MNYRIEQNDIQPYYLICLSGPFSLEDLEKCYSEVVSTSQWSAGTDIIWDARKCSFDHLNSEDLSMIGKMTLRYRNQRGKGKAAWVVSREIDFAISRMFGMLNEERVVFDFRVFKNIDNARNFICSSPE